MAGFAHHLLTNSHLAPALPGRGLSLAALARRIEATAAEWRQRQRDRETLAHLSERELRDIGLSSADVAVELAKPFWRG